MIIKNSITPFLFGLGMLTVVPKNYECLNTDNGGWEPCSHSYVCAEKLDSDHYRPV